jgi:hypothetical protein
MKMVTLKMDIERRLKRQRPRGHADLYSLKKRYNLQSIGIENFDLIVLGKVEGKFYQLKDITEEEYKQHLANGAKLRESVKEIYYEIDVDIPRFLKTMKWTLDNRYRMEKSIEDISKDLVLPRNTNQTERLKMQMRICKENEMGLTTNYIMKINNLRLEEEEKQKLKESNVEELTSKRLNELKNHIEDSIQVVCQANKDSQENQLLDDVVNNSKKVNTNTEVQNNILEKQIKKKVLKKKSI